MHLSEGTISGADVVVEVSTTGTFTIKRNDDGEAGDTIASGATLEEATNRARSELSRRKVKVSIPFVTKSGERCVAVGIHAKNRSILTRDSNDKSGTLSGYNTRDVLRGDTPDLTIARIRELSEQVRSANAERAELEKEHEFDLFEAVTVAVAEAQTKQ